MPAIGLGTFGSDRVPGERVAAAVLRRHPARLSPHRLRGGLRQRAPDRRVARARDGRRASGATSCGSPRSSGMTTTSRPRSLRRSSGHCAICASTTSTCTSSTGRSRTPISRASTSAPATRMPSPTATSGTWRPGPRWRQLVERGLVRHIGTSNMTIPKLRLVLSDARIPPAANEMELHPHFQQPELFEFVRANGMVPIGFAPVGSPARPDRDRTPDDTRRRRGPGDRRASRGAWASTRRSSASSGPSSAARCPSRSRPPAPTTTPTCGLPPASRSTDADMAAIAGIDRNCRLIKGQVFLWKAGQRWEDLWDLDGTITPP